MYNRASVPAHSLAAWEMGEPTYESAESSISIANWLLAVEGEEVVASAAAAG